LEKRRVRGKGKDEIDQWNTTERVSEREASGA